MKKFVAPGVFATAITSSLATGVLAFLYPSDVWWKVGLALALAALSAGAWLVYRLVARVVRELGRAKADLKRAVASASGKQLKETRAQGAATTVSISKVGREVAHLGLQVREVVWLAHDAQDQRIVDAEKRAVAAEARAAAAELRPAWLEVGRSTGTENV